MATRLFAENRDRGGVTHPAPKFALPISYYDR